LLAVRPDIAAIEVLSVDLNGMFRSRQLARATAANLYRRGVPGSGATTLMNSLGEPCREIGYGSGDGDPDHLLRPVPGTLVPVPWLESGPAQVLCSWYHGGGEPLAWDPRHRLQAVVDQFTALGLQPVVALEIEFYLLADGSEHNPRPRLPRIRGTSMSQPGAQYAAQEDLWDYDAFLSDVRAACALQGLPATTVHSEYAPGQFEINLHHLPDPLLACDHALLLKRLIKGVARQHGMAASFMAKPFVDLAGSGLHVHLSLRDGDGVLVFAPGGDAGPGALAQPLRHALGGLLAVMPEAQLICAPNANSYRRLRGGSFAPRRQDWASNHRAVALRLPLGDPADPRLEHRVAGADANPYLVMAAVLAGIHYGMTQGIEPPPPQGCADAPEPPPLPSSWTAALAAAEAAQILPAYFTEDYWRLYWRVRADEYERYSAEVPDTDYRWYLRNV